MASGAIDPPGDIVTASRRPPSILLAQRAYVVPSRNETTAAAKSRCDRTVEVTFWIADPPAVSFCSVHCSKPPVSDSEDADLEVVPHVLAAEGRFVLLRTRFASGDGEYEYFMYKGDVKSPSLECIPLPEDYRILDGVHDFGILPLGDGYLLAGFYDTFTSMDYGLTIYSSEDKTWRTEKMPNPCPTAGFIIPEKVITLGEGVLGMVNFWRGMLVFDLLQKPPAARYIPLPAPLPENIRKLQVYNPGATPRRVRDLTCSDGVIKFIEMEHRVIKRETREIALEKPEDPTQKGRLYDSDFRVDPATNAKGRCGEQAQEGVLGECWLEGRDMD
ncbi:hypothetical protein QOZ80_3AG0235830 [Eleusine coracana subsp. coracana]|nr:hypothetical protein QOZ80_3AG0235830 [Eleusine coracana subsp. coracana]